MAAHDHPLAAGVSAVVPVYNSEASLPDLAAALMQQLSGLSQAFEVLLVNDGSSDRSWEVIRELTKTHRAIRGLDLMQNYGQHNALLCGIRAARYGIVLTLDDDLQNPPEEIPKLLAKLAEGYDVVYGTAEKGQHGFWRNVAAQITKLTLQSALGADTARKVSAFRAFRTQLRDAFTGYQSPFVSVDVLLTWGTKRFGSVAVRQDQRWKGQSQYTLRKLITHAINMMTGFSVVPLQLATLTGFVFSFIGVVLFAYVLGRYLIHGAVVPGFAFLASAIAIFSGAQLFALGIMGEYLARMHFRMMDRPPYVVRGRAPES